MSSRFRWWARNRRERFGSRPAVAAAPVNSVPAVIAAADGASGGYDLVAGHLVITPGTWSGSPTLTYTLKRNSVAVAGLEGVSEATMEAHIFVAADIGPSLTVDEIATNGAGSNTTASNAIAWTPLSESTLYEWYGDTVTLVSGRVSVRTGLKSGKDQSQGTAAARPLQSSRDSELMIDHSDVVATAEFLDSTTFTLAQPYTYIGVLDHVNKLDQTQTIYSRDGGATTNFSASYPGTDDFSIGHGGTGRVFTPSPEGVHAVSMEVNDTVVAHVDTFTGAGTTTAATGTTGFGGLRFGLFGTGGLVTTCSYSYHGHQLFFTGALGATKRGVVGAWLNYVAYTGLTVVV